MINAAKLSMQTTINITGISYKPLQISLIKYLNDSGAYQRVQPDGAGVELALLAAGAATRFGFGLGALPPCARKM